MENGLEEGQIVLCTVENIIGTTVFVKIEGNREGTIVTSEIAPGRIRNLRDYVIPGKKIVCKILRIRDNRIHLSLRRVKPFERKELLSKIEKERSYKAIIETVLGKEDAKKAIERIKEKYFILDFFEEIRKSPKLIEDYLDKGQSEKILKILESKKEKPKEIKQVFKLSNKSSNGIVIMKNILQESCSGTKCNIKYLAAGKYSISIKGEDFKGIKSEINKTMESIETQAKKSSSEFSLEKS